MAGTSHTPDRRPGSAATVTGSTSGTPPETPAGSSTVSSRWWTRPVRPAIQPVDREWRSFRTEPEARPDELEPAIVKGFGQRLKQPGCVNHIQIAIALQKLCRRECGETVTHQAGVAARPERGVPLRSQPRIRGLYVLAGPVTRIDFAIDQDAGDGGDRGEPQKLHHKASPGRETVVHDVRGAQHPGLFQVTIVHHASQIEQGFERRR